MNPLFELAAEICDEFEKDPSKRDLVIKRLPKFRRDLKKELRNTELILKGQ